MEAIFKLSHLGRSGLLRPLLAPMLILLGGISPRLAGADEPRRSFALAASDAEMTLETFSEQAGIQIVYLIEDVRGVRTNPVYGDMPVREALERLVARTGLGLTEEGRTGAFVVRREKMPPPAPPVSSANLPVSHPAEKEPMKRKTPLAAVATWLGLSLLSTSPGRAADASPSAAGSMGLVSGTVGNAATRNLLEGAKVELPELGLSALTDNTGRFVLPSVPVGTHAIVATYLGLNSMKSQIVVTPGRRTTRDFELTSEIYKLDEFKVVGEREGSAAALTAQRNAPNVTNVVSMDQFGYLPNMSIDNLAIRLPGVTADITESMGAGGGLQIRGQEGGLNRVSIDDAPTADHGGFTRLFQGDRFNAAMFDQLELIKGHTPDRGADSLGGTINLKTRSPLSMSEKRRVVYNFTARWAPPFTEQIPVRRDHPVHPLINLSYQEVFGIRGQERNLGVALNLFWSENFIANYRTDRQFENTLASPAYLFSINARDSYQPAYTGAVNLKLDHRFSPTTKFTLNGVYNSWLQTRIRNKNVTFSAAQSVGTTGTAGILPGYTDLITEARPIATSMVAVANTGISRNHSVTRSVDFGAEHDFKRLKIDYNLGLSKMLAAFEADHGGGNLNFRITGIGWRVDRTESDLYPRMIQTAGPDITNSDNYEPNGFLSSRNKDFRYNRVKSGRFNVRYELPTPFALALKTGAVWRQNNVGIFQPDGMLRWTYIGTGKIPSDPSIVTWNYQKTGLRIPFWSPEALVNDRKPVTPELWREDIYFREASKYTGTQAVTETVTAGYVMTQGKVGRAGFLGGIRMERTQNESWGWVRAHSGSTAAQQSADPFGAVQRDYANTFREIEGGYTKAFPSAHLSYELTPDLKARASWSTSFARPDMNNLLPNETFNDAQQILTINNPALKPQTAENWDATLEYYFEPVGNFSAGWFHKDIRDYIVRGVVSGTVPTGTDNGFNGEYAGYEIRTSANAGTAIVQGWEFSYQQQLTFLPGILKGLSVGANYTVLSTHGDFGGGTNLRSGAVPNFVPRSTNVSVSWRYRRFNARVLFNENAGFLSAVAATPARNVFKKKVTIVNAGIGYQYRPWLGFTCDVTNLFNEPIVFYVGRPDRMSQTVINGTKVELGVNGRF